MPTFYAVVNILKYENGKLMFSDNDEEFEEILPTTNTGDIKQGNLMIWMAGAGVSMITDIQYEPKYTQYFATLPKPKYGGNVWLAKLKRNAPVDLQMKYSISFKPKNEETITIDPTSGSKPGPE